MATTLDPAEIAKFSALAAEWWNPKGPFGALHRLNPVRLQYIREVAQSVWPDRRPPLKDVSTLDLGCGGGLVSAPLARMGANLTAIDASAEAIGAARAYAEQAGLAIDFQCTTAEALLDTGACFDLVTALEIVEHVADVNAFLAAASALVKPGGVLILSTINRTPQARALATAMQRYGLYVADIGSSFYVQGEPGAAWDARTISQLQTLAMGQMEFVDLAAVTGDARFSRDSLAASW